MATTIDEIKAFKYRKGLGQRAKGSQGKTCSKCGMSHLPRECPAWGKKCHKCGNKITSVHILGLSSQELEQKVP